MNPLLEHRALLTRRQLFGRGATGLGVAALASLLKQDTDGADNRQLPISNRQFPNWAPKAKRIIYLFQNGAPTHVDLWDYKPRLTELHGKPVPEEYVAGKRFSTMTGKADGKLMLQPVEPFSQHGQSGAWVSRFMPHTAAIADKLCFIKSM
ncbi:MAG: DUF1501 domain-containing protein, partial [Verrucomicrobia bacterium]|nr:DUF1501 domain-containing protein [Verrucomicrobiota bacterium]